jgi:hypothetical protein
MELWVNYFRQFLTFFKHALKDDPAGVMIRAAVLGSALPSTFVG